MRDFLPQLKNFETSMKQALGKLVFKDAQSPMFGKTLDKRMKVYKMNINTICAFSHEFFLIPNELLGYR